MSYTPTVWKTGDLVSSPKLNKIENAIAELDSTATEVTADVSQLKSEISQTPIYQSLEGWVKGGMTSNMQGTNTNTNRARIQAAQLPLIPTGYSVRITPPKNYEIRAAVYSSQSFSALNEIITGVGWFAETTIIPSKYYGLKYLGMMCRKTDDSDFTDEEITALPSLFKFEILTFVGDMSGIGKTLVERIESTGVKYSNSYSYYRWSQGAINDATGGNSSNSLICRSSAYIKFGSAINGKVKFHVQSGLKIRLFEFSSQSSDGFIIADADYTESAEFTVTINQTHFYRICIGKTTQSNLSPSDIPDNAVYWEYESYSKKKDIEPSVTNNYPWTIFSVKTNLDWPDVSETSTDNAETETEQNVTCALVLPTTYTANGKPTPLIMFGHGHNGAVSRDSWYQNNANFLALVKAFQAAGYAVFDVDNTRASASGFADWGCLPLMTAYIHAWDYIKANYNVEQRLYIFSDSMGTAANLNMMKWYPSEVIASIQTAPRPICQARLEKYIEDDETTEITNFCAAFGMSSTTWEDRLNSFNHYENMVTIDNVDYILEKFPPLKVMVGTSDTLFLTEVREYYAALANFGNFVNYREVTGADHGVMSFLSDGDLTEEAIAWFDRFRQAE